MGSDPLEYECADNREDENSSNDVGSLGLQNHVLYQIIKEASTTSQ